MKNMSFMLTKSQILARSKTVTRRTGWVTLKPGDMLRAVEKGMGLKAGEKVVPLGVIRVVDVRSEPLAAMTMNVDYGMVECELEGFGDHPRLKWPSEFVEFFCNSHKGCMPESVVQRIEFEYLD